MTIRNKLIDKIMQHPPRKDVEFEDIEKVLSAYEFECIRISGSHYIFKNKKYSNIELDAIPKPHGGNKYVKRPYIEKIQIAIEEYLEMEQRNDEKK